jgi:protoporphyrinogen/coproporphyrinogen III oxidase
MVDSKKVIVVGGGISGLACALRLQQLGLPVTLLESEAGAGGLIGSVEQDGFLFESGPQSFQGTNVLLSLISQLGITAELCKADAHAPRFVLRRGRLQTIPLSPQAMATTGLLSIGARWKIVSEPFRRTRPPSGEESVANFVRRKFGDEILEYLVTPFVSGVYAGDPERLSLRAAFPSLEEWERKYGSVLRGAMKTRAGKNDGPPSLCSFRRGVGTLAQAMADKLGDNLQSGAVVNSVARSAAPARSRYQMRVSRKGREETVEADAVVIATPAYTASHLIGPLSPSAAHLLSGIEYAGVAVVAAGYYRQQIARSIDGFGFLVPRSEKLRTLGAVWNSSLFPGRARPGTVVVTSFIGGATDARILEKSEDEIATIVQDEIAGILEIGGPPVVARVWKHFKALPQYNLGHGYVVQQLRDAERTSPGLFFSGNYLAGPSLGKCVENGFETAEAIRVFLDLPG